MLQEIDYLPDGSLQLEDDNLTRVVDPEPWNTPRTVEYTAALRRGDKLRRALGRTSEPE